MGENGFFVKDHGDHRGVFDYWSWKRRRRLEGRYAYEVEALRHMQLDVDVVVDLDTPSPSPSPSRARARGLYPSHGSRLSLYDRDGRNLWHGRGVGLDHDFGRLASNCDDPRRGSNANLDLDCDDIWSARMWCDARGIYRIVVSRRHPTVPLVEKWSVYVRSYLVLAL